MEDSISPKSGYQVISSSSICSLFLFIWKQTHFEMRGKQARIIYAKKMGTEYNAKLKGDNPK